MPKKWTYDRLLEEGATIHPNKFSYELIKPEDIKGCKSKIYIICNKCVWRWETDIDHHIYKKRGCPNCAGNVKYTAKTFIERSKKINGDKYDYSKIKDEHVKNCYSKVPLICNTCEYEWNPTITDNITGYGCPNCANRAAWTYKKYVTKCIEVHGDKYEYPYLYIGRINARTKIPIKCKNCKYEWKPTVMHHSRGTGCPRCSGCLPWTKERFVEEGTKIHGDEYNYDLIKTIENIKEKLDIYCNNCKKVFKQDISGHIHKKAGCPNCIVSRGEVKCCEILKKLKIEYERQYTIKACPRKRYDFYLSYIEKKILLEYDGAQHFIKNNKFHRTDKDFIKQKSKDLMKTGAALNNGYYVIRIDYTQINHIEEHIKKALKSGEKLYLSTPDMYKWISDGLESGDNDNKSDEDNYENSSISDDGESDDDTDDNRDDSDTEQDSDDD